MIIYFGNILSKHGNTPTMIESLYPKLSDNYTIIAKSEEKNILFRMLSMVFNLVKYRNKAKLVLIDSYSRTAFWYLFIISQLCRFFKINYIPIIHGGEFEVRLNNSPKLSKIVFSNSYINISPSIFLKELFINKGYNVIQIPNFIEIENYPFLVKKIDKIKILWVRAFHEIYQPFLAIDIFAKIVEKYPESELCMVGPDKDGSLLKVKEYANSLNISPNIIFTGKLSKPEWIKLSENYNLFLNTSKIDNFPLTLIEAMAIGLPIVSTNAGGIPYMVKNGYNGLISGINDSTEMANNILKLYNDSELYNILVLNGREYAIKLDWSNIKLKWEEIINNAISKNN